MTAKQIVESKTDDELKELIKAYFELHSTSVAPQNLRVFVIEICSTFNLPYNLTMAESYLADEVFKRFIR